MARWQIRVTADMLWDTKMHRAPAVPDVLHLVQALLLEARVADREDLVHHQDLRLQMGSHGERQPHVHAARVVLDRRVEELLDLGEGDDLVELPLDLPRFVPSAEMTPFRKMFSRPVSSLWKPVPTSTGCSGVRQRRGRSRRGGSRASACGGSGF